MVMLSVVEAAGLSGLPPERVRHLIYTGRLPAREVPLLDGAAYLIDSTDLARLNAAPPAAPHSAAVDSPSSPRPDTLEGALAALRTSLAQRQHAGPPTADPPMAQPPEAAACRSIGGLGQAELRSLAARVDRLLTSAPPVPAHAAPEAHRAAGTRWWRRIVGRRRPLGPSPAAAQGPEAGAPTESRA